MIYLNQFFLNIQKQVRNVYLNSKFYDNKISKVDNENLQYKPSPYLLSSLINYQKKKFKIEDYAPSNIWENKKINI